MKFEIRTKTYRIPGKRGFTLAEVLAALAFMAIVIPVAIEGLRVASLAGTVAQRKEMATRIAERVLNEAAVTGRWTQTSQSGSAQEGPITFRWKMLNKPWSEDALQELSVEVTYMAQSKDYNVILSTLVDPTMTQ